MFKKNTNLKRHEQAVTVYPEVNMIKKTKDMEFIVIACDGVWDCVDDNKLCEYVSKNIKEHKNISTIISTLFDQIISKTDKCIFLLIKRESARTTCLASSFSSSTINDHYV